MPRLQGPDAQAAGHRAVVALDEGGYEGAVGLGKEDVEDPVVDDPAAVGVCGAFGVGACAGGMIMVVGASMLAAPRLRMTRLSPSRTSTVLRSCAAISLTRRSSSPTSIGLSRAAALSLFFAAFLSDFLFRANFIENGYSR